MCNDYCEMCGDEFRGATLLAGIIADGRLLCPLCVKKPKPISKSDDRIAKLVEAAYREGMKDAVRRVLYQDNTAITFENSNAKAALDAEKGGG